MLDLHSHLLPGIDDGPATLKESLALARGYVAAGFSRVAATPHWIFGTIWMPAVEDIRQRVDRFNRSLEKHEIPLRVFTGMEIALDLEIPKMLGQGRLLTLAESDSLLIETPFQVLPPRWEDLLTTIREKGYRVVLAHPERCARIIANPGLADEILETGVHLQCNYDSFLGNPGEPVFDTAMHLLKKGYIHLLATDSHDPAHRHPGTSGKAIQVLEKIIDTETLARITRINPDRLIQGEPLENPEPVRAKGPAKGGRRWWWFSEKQS